MDSFKQVINPNPDFEEETRNWVDLPRDVMIHIFHKVGVIYLLYHAQFVCSTWHKLSKEPQLFRCIDMRNFWDFEESIFLPVAQIALEAIGRSCGQLVEFSVNYSATNEVLHRIALNSSSSLRCLRLGSCYDVSDGAFIDAMKKLPLLEELELCLCSFGTEVIEAVGRSCPQLKYFRLNHKGVRYTPSEFCQEFNVEALAIAANMPQLRRLHLFGNKMNENGLKAILEKCVHLEYLDLRQCFGIHFDEELQNKCREIKTLRLPNDSTDDYEFDAALEGDYEGWGYEYDDYNYDFSDFGVFEDRYCHIYDDYDDDGGTFDYFGF